MGAIQEYSRWNGPLPRLAKSTLWLPTSLGGLALPNFYVYFWVAMLVSMYWWFTGPQSNAVVCLEADFLGSLANLHLQRTQSLRLSPGSDACPLEGVGGCPSSNQWLSAQPIWGNTSLPLSTIPGLQVWVQKSIKTLADIIPAGSFHLPVWMQFRYC